MNKLIKEAERGKGGRQEFLIFKLLRPRLLIVPSGKFLYLIKMLEEVTCFRLWG